MRRPGSSRTASLGVTLTKLVVERDLGWLFREQPTEDYGIDAQVEIVEGEAVTGKLLALQIKSGPSWFRRACPGGWWFRPDARHVRYWTDHSLPVVVVLVDAETERCYWQVINRQTLIETSSGGPKVLVPETHVLDGSARASLAEAAAGDPYVLRVRELQLAKPWMGMLVAGTRLVIDIEEWINKSSGRGSITLGIDHEDGNDPEPLASWSVLLGSASYAEVVPPLFAWADVGVHQETYDDADREEFEADFVIYDGGDRFETMNYRDWAAERELPSLRPYSNAAGEVDYWRLELALNDLGKAFLVVDKFATEGGPQLTTE